METNGWTDERVDLVKRTVVPKGIPTDEFLLFVEQCKRSGLDPLLKEAFCVGRRFNAGTKEKPNWTTKFEFQPSEAGMLARAERFPDFVGVQASEVYASDEILIDQGDGKVVHRFNPTKRSGGILGAWARLVRKDKLPVVVWLDFAGYAQQTPLWQKMPGVMLSKCARVAVLRKAYPEAFGGLYIREEMPAEEFAEEAQPARRASPALPARTATREAAEVVTPEGYVSTEQLAPAEGTLRVPSQAVAREAQQEAVQRVQKHLGGEVQKKERTPGEDDAHVVQFGKLKGKPIPELTDGELSGCIDALVKALEETPKAKWAGKAQLNLAELQAEAELRGKAGVLPEAPF